MLLIMKGKPNEISSDIQILINLYGEDSKLNDVLDYIITRCVNKAKKVVDDIQNR